ERHRLVRVPASSANLGPGYDVMAAALDIFLELEVRECGEFSVDGGGLDVPLDRTNLVVRAFETLHSADGIHFRIGGDIPLARGMGSSAAAIVAGLVAADHLFELGLDHQQLLEHANRLEGHPDNVAAAISGGFVICSKRGDRVTSTRIDAPEGLEGILVIPHEAVSTSDARRAIPAEVPVNDLVGNVSSVALLTLGLSRGDYDLISAGLTDSLHQERRRHLFPKSMEVVEMAAEFGAIGATISGAGPTVLVWSGWQETGSVMNALKDRCGGWAEVRRVGFSPLGADVPEL
ncbi:MAG: homoserine kinase, partial [Cryobacterium sp.]|nr:homoserine kinase [Cryobacterium sp.]